nr:hypothetical protein [Tanacetum cinerariifolium]
MSASDYVDAVHNFLLSQKLTTLLGNFPEVLQVSDLLEYKGACSDRGVIILLVFLSSQLIVKRNLQQINFHKLLGHNQTSERKCVRRDRNLENHDKALHAEETCLNRNEEILRLLWSGGKKWRRITAKPVRSQFMQRYKAFLPNNLVMINEGGVTLHDEDGTEIITEDIVNGDKELVISLLWNMFVHLQLPLLINNKLVSDEITNIRGPEAILPNTPSQLDMLLEWIKELKETNASDYVDAVHNFLLSQKLTTLLGNFPEQQINFHKLLGHNQTSERKCVRRDRNLENHDEALHAEETCLNRNEDNGRNFKAIMEWWKEMAQNNGKASEKPVYAALQGFPSKQFSDDQR